MPNGRFQMGQRNGEAYIERTSIELTLEATLLRHGDAAPYFSIDKLCYGALPVDYCGNSKWVYYKVCLQCLSYNQPPESSIVHPPISNESLGHS